MENGGWRLHADADLRPLEPLWRSAYSEHIFQPYELNAAWARIFGGKHAATSGPGWQIRVWYRDSPPRILPWVRRGETLSWLGCGLFDYADPLGEPEAFTEIPLPREAGRWNLPGIRAHSPWLPVFQKLAHASESHFTRCGAAPFCSGITAAELEQNHPRIAARWRELERKGAGYEAVRDPGAKQRLLGQMLRWKRLRMGAGNVLQELECGWLAEMATHDFCELWRLGDAADWAGFLTWRHGGARYGYTLAHDPAWAPTSPGVKLLYAVLRQSLREGLRFDFLTGEQDFKLRFATGREPLWRLDSGQAKSNSG